MEKEGGSHSNLQCDSFSALRGEMVESSEKSDRKIIEPEVKITFDPGLQFFKAPLIRDIKHNHSRMGSTVVNWGLKTQEKRGRRRVKVEKGTGKEKEKND